MSVLKKVIEPCMGNCTIMNGGNQCDGCYRTHKEKLKFNNMSDPEKANTYIRAIKRAKRDKEDILEAGNLDSEKRTRLIQIDEIIESHTEDKLELQERIKDHKSKVLEIRTDFHKNGISQKVVKSLFNLDRNENLIRKIKISTMEAGTIAGTNDKGVSMISIFGVSFRKDDLVNCYLTGFSDFSGNSKTESEFSLGDVIDISSFIPSPSGLRCQWNSRFSRGSLA